MDPHCTLHRILISFRQQEYVYDSLELAKCSGYRYARAPKGPFRGVLSILSRDLDSCLIVDTLEVKAVLHAPQGIAKQWNAE